MKDQTSPETVFKQTSTIEPMEAGEGFVLYDEVRDRVHFLNSTAALIFELCKEGCSVADIAYVLSDGFALGASPIDDVTSCLTSLEIEHLVHRIP